MIDPNNPAPSAFPEGDIPESEDPIFHLPVLLGSGEIVSLSLEEVESPIVWDDPIISVPEIPASGEVVSIPLKEMLDSIAPSPPVIRTGSKKADILAGWEGSDVLNGGLGNDTLIGGGGQDTFVFSTKLGPKNVDRIVDFNHADDTIRLSKAIFSKIKKGVLTKDAFWVGAKAHDKSDRIIYNKKTGALFYDADGSGTKYKAVKFAQLKAKTLVTADDFFIV